MTPDEDAPSFDVCGCRLERTLQSGHSALLNQDERRHWPGQATRSLTILAHPRPPVRGTSSSRFTLSDREGTLQSVLRMRRPPILIQLLAGTNVDQLGMERTVAR
jgi:hypothetical protein